MGRCQDVCVMTHGSPAVRPPVDVRCAGEATMLVEFDPAAAHPILFHQHVRPVLRVDGYAAQRPQLPPLPRNQA